MTDNDKKTIEQVFLMYQEWLADEPGAIRPIEADFLAFETMEEAHLWGVFEEIWHDIRSGMGGGTLTAVGAYCNLFNIRSIYERQLIFELVKYCLPFVKKDK